MVTQKYNNLKSEIRIKQKDEPRARTILLSVEKMGKKGRKTTTTTSRQG
jgi:hypothetical protein